MDSAREFPNLLTEIYLHIYCAVAYKKLGLFQEACQAVNRAVDLSAEDRICIPFVENGEELVPLLDSMLFPQEQAPFLGEIRRIYEENRQHLSVVLGEADQSPLSILTKREQEIALLVSDGKTNIEIARALNLAEITVKKSLSNIYARLGVTNRAALAKSISM